MKILFFLVLFSLASAKLFAQTDTFHAPSSQALDTTAMAKIYVIRSTGHVGSAVNLRVVVDDINMCKVRNNRYAVVYVAPGTHNFNATSWDKPGSSEKFSLKMSVEAGKTYYLTMQIKQRFMGIEIYLEEVTYNTAGPLLSKYKQDQCD
jgi:hypothetical protein